MAEKDIVLKEKVKHAGLLDFKAFYQYAYNWLTSEKYDISEEQYSEKVKGNEKEIEIMWTATRKVSDYFKFELSIKWQVLKMSEVEVEIEGKKKSMNKVAEINVTTKGILVRDWQSSWEHWPFYNFMREVYNKYVIPGRILRMQEKVIEDVQTFNGELKAFLELTGRR